jgi:hypothetical protein
MAAPRPRIRALARLLRVRVRVRVRARDNRRNLSAYTAEVRIWVP